MGNVNVVQFLLGKGADLESEDAEGNTFLHSISSSDSGKLWAWAIDTVNNRMLTHLVDKKNSVSAVSIITLGGRFTPLII